MRPILHGDVTAVARAIYRLSPEQQRRMLSRMLCEAELADCHRRRTGRAHPLWGNGSLMAVAGRYGSLPEPGLEDRGYCAALARVFEALVARAGSGNRRELSR